MQKYKVATLALAVVAYAVAGWACLSSDVPVGIPRLAAVGLNVGAVSTVAYMLLAVVPDVVRAYAVGYRDGMAQARESSRV